ncbi:MAG TPA: S8 family peptidase [Vicinamibacterales bacterium]
MSAAAGRYAPKPGEFAPCEMVRLRFILAALLAASPAATFAAAGQDSGNAKLDRTLQQRAQAPQGHSRVILRLSPGTDAESAIRGLRGTAGRRLVSIGGQVADIPDVSLDALSQLPGVDGISVDRRIEGTLERTGTTIGASWVHDNLGFDGTGVGVAIVDSGVANWHDDLGSDRVLRFVDFVNFQPTAYDDYGHGTHVAGIIAGNGYDSGGRRRGIAPGATLLVEKVLDASGQGYISNVIAAIDYAIANKDALHLRVLNLSVAAGVYESYTTDPLTLAAKRAVDAGFVVVTAAGNLGRNKQGQPEYGGIGAPGNAPWVITVGASNHMGTIDRSDDTVAGFSSRGPTAIDRRAKPDLVAPGVGIESLAEAGSTLYNTKPLMRLWGTVQTATEPYISLSGTSMASPVVSGTIALMLQANPTLTPNLVKAILEFTAETRTAYDGLTQGAGFLNARGAVELAQRMASVGVALDMNAPQDDPTPWSRHVIWGNRLVGGDAMGTGAWATDVTWGADTGKTSSSDTGGVNVVWGSVCGGADCDPATVTTGVVWATVCGADAACDSSPSVGVGPDPLAWGTNSVDVAEDVVWSSLIRYQSRVPVTDPATGGEASAVDR